MSDTAWHRPISGIRDAVGVLGRSRAALRAGQIDLAVDRIENLEPGLVNAVICVRNQAIGLDLDPDLLNDVGLVRDQALALGLDPDYLNVVRLARDLARGLTRGLTRDLARDGDLGKHLVPARALLRVLRQAAAHRGASGALSAHLLFAVDAVADLIDVLERAAPAAEKCPGRPVVVVSSAARRVTEFAVCLLPAGSRSTKSEEFAAELYDIAAVTRSRGAQVAYALRLLATVIPLRRALAGGERRALERR